MSFKDNISGSFGTVDKIFAGHPLDMDRAIDLLRASVKENISLNELLVAVEDYLRKEGAGDEHIAEQLANIKHKFAGWLE